VRRSAKKLRIHGFFEIGQRRIALAAQVRKRRQHRRQLLQPHAEAHLFEHQPGLLPVKLSNEEDEGGLGTFESHLLTLI